MCKIVRLLTAYPHPVPGCNFLMKPLWTQLIHSGKTLAVYYSVTKSDKKHCIQKNMDFVDGHTTPSSVTTASEKAKSSRFKNKDIKCFLWSGEAGIFLRLSLGLGIDLLLYPYYSFWTGYSTVLELPLAFRNQIFNANSHMTKEESAVKKIVLWAERLYAVSISWFLSPQYKMLPIKILIYSDNKLKCQWLAFLFLQCCFGFIY